MSEPMIVEVTIYDGRKFEASSVVEIIEEADGTILLKREFGGLRQNMVFRKGQIKTLRVKLI